MTKFSAFIVIFLFVVSIATPALAQTDKAAEKKEPIDNSCFVLEGGSNFDFGVVDQNETVEHTFVFKNNCDRVIHIDAARASCGCTAAVLSEKDVKPGGEAKINVKFTPPRMSNGKITKTVSVYVDGDSRPHTTIRFTANVKADLMIQPRHISLHGATVGERITGKATIKNMTSEAMEIETVISINSYADTSSSGSRAAVQIPLKNAQVSEGKFTIAPNDERDITVSLTPEYKGQLNGNVRFKSGKNETWLQVYGIVRDKDSSEIRK